MMKRDLTNKTRLLAGMALGCVLGSPAALAEEYRGFYFTAWGGSGEMDGISKEGFDEDITSTLASEISSAPMHSLTLIDGSLGDSDLDDSLAVWGAQVGYRFNKWVAVEVGYVDLGELLYTLPGQLSGIYREIVCANRECSEMALLELPINGDFERATQITSAGITGSVLGMFPIGPRFDLHVRGGLYMADTRVTNRLRFVEDPIENTNLDHDRVDASQTELFAGIGGAWNINQNFALRVEYQRYFDVGDDEKTGESDVDVLNLSVLFK